MNETNTGKQHEHEKKYSGKCQNCSNMATMWFSKSIAVVYKGKEYTQLCDACNNMMSFSEEQQTKKLTVYADADTANIVNELGSTAGFSASEIMKLFIKYVISENKCYEALGLGGINRDVIERISRGEG